MARVFFRFHRELVCPVRRLEFTRNIIPNDSFISYAEMSFKHANVGCIRLLFCAVSVFVRKMSASND